jgi:DNA repair protein RadA/Sms
VRGGGWVQGSGGAELIEDVTGEEVDRITTGTRELDRVLNGGFASAGAYILSGDPGTGKSTLVLQVMNDLADAEIEKPTGEDETGEPWSILIAAGEETKGQIHGRWKRLMDEAPSRKLQLRLANQTDVFEIEKLLEEHDPDILVIDSAQTLTMSGFDSPAGSPGLIKAATGRLVQTCKRRGTCLIMIAHVNKNDELAGPKTFEHLVDGVMHLSDEDPYRVLRMSKHRFGPTTEVGIFLMGPKGMQSVENPSELLLANHLEGVPGCVIACMSDQASEGAARAILVEVQALTVTDPLGKGPFVSAMNMEGGRVRALLAVLAARVDVTITGQVFTSIAGGVRSKDPGIDLPCILGLLSSSLDQDLPEGFCCFGEVGLAGEIRPPKNVEGRVKAALAMKFTEIMGPPIDEALVAFVERESGGETSYTEVHSVAEAIEELDWDVKPKPVKKTRKKKRK